MLTRRQIALGGTALVLAGLAGAGNSLRQGSGHGRYGDL